jgi:hypothetical protein
MKIKKYSNNEKQMLRKSLILRIIQPYPGEALMRGILINTIPF